MKTMLIGFAATVVIAVGAYFGLDAAGFSSAAEFSSPNVRLN